MQLACKPCQACIPVPPVQPLLYMGRRLADRTKHVFQATDCDMSMRANFRTNSKADRVGGRVGAHTVPQLSQGKAAHCVKAVNAL